MGMILGLAARAGDDAEAHLRMEYHRRCQS